MNGLKQLSLAELADIDDGRIGLAFDQALKRVSMDCDDRPGDNRPRKVVLEMTVEPVCGEDGVCESVTSQIQIKESLPTRRSKKYDLGLRKNGIFVFQPMSLDNHAQTTFEMGDE